MLQCLYTIPLGAILFSDKGSEKLFAPLTRVLAPGPPRFAHASSFLASVFASSLDPLGQLFCESHFHQILAMTLTGLSYYGSIH
jgi:hypothetical protein